MTNPNAKRDHEMLSSVIADYLRMIRACVELAPTVKKAKR